MSDFIGDPKCKFNALSPFIRCAINPDGPCEKCLNFEKVRNPSKIAMRLLLKRSARLVFFAHDRILAISKVLIWVCAISFLVQSWYSSPSWIMALSAGAKVFALVCLMGDSMNFVAHTDQHDFREGFAARFIKRWISAYEYTVIVAVFRALLFIWTGK